MSGWGWKASKLRVTLVPMSRTGRGRSTRFGIGIRTWSYAKCWTIPTSTASSTPPYVELDRDGQQRWSDFMPGNFAWKYDNDAIFRKFKRQLYHASLFAILSTLEPPMTAPVICRCPGVLLAGTVQNWCPECAALPSDLDGPSGRRSYDDTDTLMAAFSPRVLCDEHGIDADIFQDDLHIWSLKAPSRRFGFVSHFF
ncbi:hypothetical protein B0H19DRAFT_1256905 [Mycena capillaripes]|nr:hypothetical protein B0H19DRAFT_1256905 [Mycena capillaripes]